MGHVLLAQEGDGNKVQYHVVFAGVIERGASFRALVWANILETSQNIDVGEDIYSINNDGRETSFHLR